MVVLFTDKIKKIGCILWMFLLSSSVSPEESQPYFLSWSQKGQLMLTGHIQEQEVWYNVHLLPGYQPISHNSRRHLGDAGDNLLEYFQRKKYRDLINGSGDALIWGFNDALIGTTEATGKAWVDSMVDAQSRVEKKVFGWWFAYPWAGLKASSLTVVNTLGGVGGAAAGTAWGLAGNPILRIVDSAGKATWNGGVGGIALPLLGAGWNTVLGMPMAIAGRRPAPSRLDAFWISRTYVPASGKPSSGRSFSEDEMEAALAIARAVYNEQWETPPSRQQEIAEQSMRVRQIKAELKAAVRALDKLKIADQREHAKYLEELYQRELTRQTIFSGKKFQSWLRHNHVAFRKELAKEIGNRSDAIKVIRYLEK